MVASNIAVEIPACNAESLIFEQANRGVGILRTGSCWAHFWMQMRYSDYHKAFVSLGHIFPKAE